MFSELLAVFGVRSVWVRKREVGKLAESTLLGRACWAVLGPEVTNWKYHRRPERLRELLWDERMFSSQEREVLLWWLQNVGFQSLEECLVSNLDNVKLWNYGESLSWFFEYESQATFELADPLPLLQQTFRDAWHPFEIARLSGWRNSHRHQGQQDLLSSGAFANAQDFRVGDWMEKQGIPTKVRQKVAALTFWDYEDYTIFYLALDSRGRTVAKGFSRWDCPEYDEEDEPGWEKKVQEERCRVQTAILNLCYKPKPNCEAE